jgi:hypothetical protein
MTMRLKWTKADDGWVCVGADFTAKVGNPKGPLGFSHWSVRCGGKEGGSGGTSSVAQSKRSAESEVDRFLKHLGLKAEIGSLRERVARLEQDDWI